MTSPLKNGVVHHILDGYVVEVYHEEGLFKCDILSGEDGEDWDFIHTTDGFQEFKNAYQAGLVWLLRHLYSKLPKES